MRTTVRAAALAAAITMGGVPLAPGAGAAEDLDCGDFASREEAQAVLDQDRSDPNGLDDDRDGVACEGAGLPARGVTPGVAEPDPDPTVVAGDSQGTTGAWAVWSDGEVSPVATAEHHGEVTGRLNAPIVDMAGSATGEGYWLLGGDGGVFSFGDARFSGSTGSLRLDEPLVAMARGAGGGYHLAAGDGGVFAFGEPFLGSMGGVRLNQPVVGIASTTSGGGYWLVARDGGIFSFGDARYSGSTGSTRLNQPIVGVAADPDGRGYWLAGADGGIFSFDATFHGSAVGAGYLADDDAVVDIAPHPGGGYFLFTESGGIIGFGSASTVASPPS